MVMALSTPRLTAHSPRRFTSSGLKPEPSSTPSTMIMPWRRRTFMPMRRPKKAATVAKTQAPSIQASGMRSQSNTKPPAVPIASASRSGP